MLILEGYDPSQNEKYIDVTEDVKNLYTALYNLGMSKYFGYILNQVADDKAVFNMISDPEADENLKNYLKNMKDKIIINDAVEPIKVKKIIKHIIKVNDDTEIKKQKEII
ncbi:MAG: hypothetical protein KatS3mg003_1069 [Candidatus Nitrosocaldaceae archaeon]|nr:MAG: hypothetical protein KatS3mg003_1069 [Candidatus Nitrosocaldaceae archaeon]